MHFQFILEQQYCIDCPYQSFPLQVVYIAHNTIGMYSFVLYPSDGFEKAKKGYTMTFKHTIKCTRKKMLWKESLEMMVHVSVNGLLLGLKELYL
jgi:hypothetical protein